MIDGLIYPSAWLLREFCIIAHSKNFSPLNINIWYHTWFLYENGRIFRIISPYKWKIGKWINYDVNVRKNRHVFRIINRFLKFIPWKISKSADFTENSKQILLKKSFCKIIVFQKKFEINNLKFMGSVWLKALQIKNFEKYFSFEFLDWHFWQNFYNFLKFS
jgi:hypothetical protein